MLQEFPEKLRTMMNALYQRGGELTHDDLCCECDSKGKEKLRV